MGIFEDVASVREQAYGLPRGSLDISGRDTRLKIARALIEHWEFDNAEELVTEASTIAAWVEEGGEPGNGLPLPAELVETVEAYDRVIRRWSRLWPAVWDWASAGQGATAAATLVNVAQEINDEMRETGEGK